MRSLDLFSGIGGFALGLESVGFKTSAFCERDTYCQKVLAKHWPSVPIHPDITELNGYEYRGAIELVCGGFPCQPYSVAGKQLGKEDDRAIWREMLRVIREVAPRWVIGENVSGIIQMELDQVLSDLEGEGYTCWTFVIPACAVDAHHRRDRVWIVAHAHSVSQSNGTKYEQKQMVMGDTISKYRRRDTHKRRPKGVAMGGHLLEKAGRVKTSNSVDRSSADVAHTNGAGLQGRQEIRNAQSIRAHSYKQSERCANSNRPKVWKSESGICRTLDGVPNRSHRLKALGNAVVPQVVAEIGRMVMAYDKEHLCSHVS